MTTDGDALEFAERVLALLDRGSFVATYKYAVLIGLIDLCIEKAGAMGAPPTSIGTDQLALKVVQLYWPQVRPFGGAGLLDHDKGRHAVIPRLIRQFRERQPDASASFARARLAGGAEWTTLLRGVEWCLVEMPLPRVQVLGASENRFIYQIAWQRDAIKRSEFRGPAFDNQIRFVCDAADHLVRLAGVLRPVLQREWATMVAQINKLLESRLEDFLFGPSRQGTGALGSSLRELQDDRCFYCGSRLPDAAHVDHFIPWSRHPDDGVENLVVADARCNSAKSDHLAALLHVARWRARAEEREGDLAEIALRHRWEAGAGRAVATARGIYFHLARGVPTWLEGRRFVEIEREELRMALG